MILDWHNFKQNVLLSDNYYQLLPTSEQWLVMSNRRHRTDLRLVRAVVRILAKDTFYESKLRQCGSSLELASD